MPEFNDIRNTMLDNGYLPLPICGKACYVKGWSTATIDADFIQSHSRKRAWRSTGIRCGSVVAVDIDVDHEGLADLVEREARKNLGDTPFVRYGQGHKRVLLYWNDVPDRRRRTAMWTRPGESDRFMVEFLGKGSLVVAYGTHPSGVEYR